VIALAVTLSQAEDEVNSPRWQIAQTRPRSKPSRQVNARR
jgi:hypothetical protein